MDGRTMTGMPGKTRKERGNLVILPRENILNFCRTPSQSSFIISCKPSVYVSLTISPKSWQRVIMILENLSTSCFSIRFWENPWLYEYNAERWVVTPFHCRINTYTKHPPYKFQRSIHLPPSTSPVLCVPYWIMSANANCFVLAMMNYIVN